MCVVASTISRHQPFQVRTMFRIQLLLALLATSQAFTFKGSSTYRNLKRTAVTDVDSQFYNPTDDEFYNMFLRTLSDKSTSLLSFEGDETEKDLIEQKAVLDRMGEEVSGEWCSFTSRYSD